MATLLMIDDDASMHDSVEAPLRGTVDHFLHAMLPEDGLRLALSELPDVILLDMNMPGLDGLKVCRLLKETSATRDIPVIFVTVEANVESLARAFDIGGADYITKPFNDLELCGRVSVALRTKQAFDLLTEQARIDGLTSLANRTALDSHLFSAVASHERNGHPLSLLMVDLDEFKKINDTYGHGIGDQVLRRVGLCLSTSSRPYDIPCRYGGDEFVVLLGHTEGAGARSAAERILANLHATEFEVHGESIPIRASSGLATSSGLRDGFAAADLLKAADRALYAAKRAGGQCLVDAADTTGNE